MKKKLIIYDKEGNSSKIKDILAKALPNYIVQTAQSGVDGVKIAAKEQPDTILLDFNKAEDKLTSEKEQIDKSVIEALRESEEKYRTLAENMSDLVFQIDPELRVIALNRAAEEMIGDKTGNFINKRFTEIFPPKISKKYETNLRKVFETAKPLVSDSMLEINNSKFFINTKLTPILNETGKVKSIIGVSRDITKRKLAEEAMQESEEKYRAIFEATGTASLIVDEDTTIINANRECERVTGYSASELIGKSWTNFADKEDLQRMLSHHMARRKDSGSIPKKYEVRLIDAKGDVRNTILSVEIIPGSKKSIVSLLDITERVKAEKLLSKSEDRYRSLVNNLPVGVFRSTPQGKVLSANPAMAEIYGYDSVDELLKVPAQDYYTKNNPRENMLSELKKQTYLLGYETQENRKDGSLIWVSTNYKSITNDKGEMRYIDGVIIDISEQKKTELALQQHSLQLQERNKELDAFSHTVAHDLKNPLGTIMGFADLLFENHSKLSKDEMMEYLNIIIKDGKKTQQIINSLLLFANIRKSEISTEELNMRNIVAESIESLMPLIEKSNAEIILPDIWPTAIGYTPWIEEVWVNYLSNAIKYGGKPPHIEIGFDKGKAENIKEGMIRFWVRDNGIGISAENQKLLFNKFERLDQVKTEGHGLGLSIVLRIIEKLGGQVGVESELGKGSRFYFTLPYSNIAEEKHANNNEVSEPKKNNRFGNLKILVAEDDEFSDTHLSIIIKKISKETLHAKNGNETVEVCRANPDIDLILMDIRMPEMSGYDATRKIREFNKDVIIIAQTAYAVQGGREKAFEAGFNDYITKPIKKDNLLEMIEKLFAK
ncbi:MAG: PAS domain S-box protein [Bacteroidales bacterium]|nr:PAS domain S-box protein [Bacteroidales bacterium]